MKGVNAMSIKDKLGKMKSFLFDDEEDDSKKINIKKPGKDHKKEDVKGKDEELSKTKEIESMYFEDISEIEPDVTEPKEEVIKSRAERKEIDFDFPEFNDNDFMQPEPEIKPEPEPIVSYAREEVKSLLYQGSKRNTDTKRFKPTPMISPVYGLLDEDGSAAQHGSSRSSRNKEEVSIDDVRKKAYGSFDEDKKTDIKLKTIEEAEKDMEKEEKEIEVKEEKPIIVNDEDDDMVLPNINFKEIDIEAEVKEESKAAVDEAPEEEKAKSVPEDDEDDEDTKEQDLFNLIDSMYQKEGEEE